MGILDYIQERDTERSGRLPWVSRWEGYPVRLEVACPYDGCDRAFRSTDALHRHLSLEHPIDLPLLKLHERTLPREVNIRLPLEASDWSILYADRCDITEHGRPATQVAVEELPSILAGRRHGRLSITLTHHRPEDQGEAKSRFSISFKVLEEKEAEAIDACFLATTASRAISVETADMFFQQCPRPHGAAREYAGALADYLIGCALKEARGDGDQRLGFERFKDKFNEALAVLKEVPSPLACAVAGIIRFNLNEFEAASELTDWVPAIAASSRFFLAPEIGGAAPPAIEPVADRAGIPVDHVTEQITRLAISAANVNLSIEDLGAELQRLKEHSPLAETDRQKIETMRAALLLRQEAWGDLKIVVGRLRGDPVFGPWAQTLPIR